MKKKRLVALIAILLITFLVFAAYRRHWGGVGEANGIDCKPVPEERADANPVTQSNPETVEGLAQNYVTPFELYEMRPGRGDAEPSDLGLKDESNAPARDYASVREALEKAAATGDGQACFALAVLYEKGMGVAPDSERAGELFARACEAGFQKACVECRRRIPSVTR